jgi:alpha-ketoglutarate-dependent taurine dioxygenase
MDQRILGVTCFCCERIRRALFYRPLNRGFHLFVEFSGQGSREGRNWPTVHFGLDRSCDVFQKVRKGAVMSLRESDIREISIAGQLPTAEGVFPRVLTPGDPKKELSFWLSWISEQADTLSAIAQRDGVILFRGFPLQSALDFDAWISAFDWPNFSYLDSLSNAVRVNLTPRVFTANEAPAEVTIFLHHEMAQTPIYPQKLFFYCETPAEKGGATPVCRSDLLYQQLEKQAPDFLFACETKGLQYTNVMPSGDDPNSGMGRSWQSTLGTEDAAQAEARLGELNYAFQWLDGDCLKVTTPPLPAVQSLCDGRKVFFNQLIAAFMGWKDQRNDPSKAIRHGDGTVLDREAVLKAGEIADSLTFDVPWQRGDIALVDNRVAMHGRRTFTGKRRVLASLVQSERQTFQTIR